MAITIQPKSGLPIPPIMKKGEKSEYAKELLKLQIGEHCDFTGFSPEDIKKFKYTANKLQKDGEAWFSFRKGSNGEPDRMWRVAPKPKRNKSAAETTSPS